MEKNVTEHEHSHFGGRRGVACCTGGWDCRTATRTQTDQESIVQEAATIMEDATTIHSAKMGLAADGSVKEARVIVPSVVSHGHSHTHTMSTNGAKIFQDNRSATGTRSIQGSNVVPETTSMEGSRLVQDTASVPMTASTHGYHASSAHNSQIIQQSRSGAQDHQSALGTHSVRVEGGSIVSALQESHAGPNVRGSRVCC
jgi:hypothetical protein